MNSLDWAQVTRYRRTLYGNARKRMLSGYTEKIAYYLVRDSANLTQVRKGIVRVLHGFLLKVDGW